jgi:tRNA(Ile2) C34 agmatinyltransferase TiaS
MDLLALARLVTDEQKAFQYLLSRMRSPSCPFCNGKTFYIMSRTRLRCSRCRNDFRPLLATLIGKGLIKLGRGYYPEPKLIEACKVVGEFAQ